MLILSREVGQSIMIGDDIVIEVSGYYRNQIKLAISAPKHVSVHRSEIYQKIKHQEHLDSLTYDEE